MKDLSKLDRAAIEHARDVLCGLEPAAQSDAATVRSVVDAWLAMKRPLSQFDEHDDDRHVPVDSPARKFAQELRSCGIPAGARMSSEDGCHGVAVVHGADSRWITVDHPCGDGRMLRTNTLPRLLKKLRATCTDFTADEMRVVTTKTCTDVGRGFEAAWEVISG